MGKRLVILDADFSQVGIKETYTEYETTTEQGLIDATADAGKTLLPTSIHYYNEYVHSNTSIILHPGETVAIVERPDNTTSACIFAYTSVTSIYPALVCTSSSQTIGTPISDWADANRAEARNRSVLPRVLTNDSSVNWYIAFDIKNPDGISPATCPTIKYRIYSAI